MDREATKKMIEVMDAYVNGKSIQGRQRGSKDWFNIDSPQWYWDRWEYRIKSEVEHKYAVGDYVLVLDGSGIENYTGNFVDEMEEYIGRIFQIKSAYEIGALPCYKLQGGVNCFTFDERGLAPVKIGE